jgi:hypothetical protein
VIEHEYWYKGYIVRTGPSLVLGCVLDLGFGKWMPMSLGLLGCRLLEDETARERTTFYVSGWADRCEREMRVRVVRTGKGYEGEFWQAGSDRSLNEELLSEGHVEPSAQG